MINKKINLGFILGHHPILSIAEVLSINNNMGEIVAGDEEFLLINDASENFENYENCMGGSQKIFKYEKISTKESLFQCSFEYINCYVVEKKLAKIEFSLSVYGKYKKYQKELLLFLKKELSKKFECKVRFLNKKPDRNPSNQFLQTSKIVEKGIDLVVCEDKGKFFIGRTIWIQNIDNYTKRDIDRPYRDMANGILPPKLAQVLLNLVFDKETILWDPFCGSGGILMEAYLQKRKIIGSDNNEDILKHARMNLKWLKNQDEFKTDYNKTLLIEKLDVEELTEIPSVDEKTPESIVTEGYLGQNFIKHPSKEEIYQNQKMLLNMYNRFFENLYVLKYRFKNIILTLPVYQIGDKDIYFSEFYDLPQSYGYKIVSIINPKESTRILHIRDYNKMYSKRGTILYRRNEQFVGREIVKIIM